MKWTIEYEENAGEYTGTLIIAARNLNQLNNYVVIADEVVITFDEKIIKIDQEEK